MKIGIDISSLVYGTGVSRYTHNLVKALIAEFPDQSFSLFGGSLRQWNQLNRASRKLKSGFNRILPIPPKLQSILFNKMHAPIDWFLKDVDVFHSWDWYVPGAIKSALVTTVHDLSAIKYPQDTHPEIVNHHQTTLEWIKNHAKVIIAVSQATKQDLVQIMDIDPNRIEVIYEALPIEQEITPSQASIKEIAQRLKINRPYFIIVGSQEPRKNMNRMIQAFEPFQKTHQLVIVGKSGFDSIADQPYVLKTGYLNAHDLAAVYHQAEGLLYCSISEGFGLPILEAFYHQIPVITSNVSSMPEVAGKGAQYANPLDAESITQAMHATLRHRKNLIAEGQKQLAKFSWQKVARQTMESYLLAYVKK